MSNKKKTIDETGVYQENVPRRIFNKKEIIDDGTGSFDEIADHYIKEDIFRLFCLLAGSGALTLLLIYNVFYDAVAKQRSAEIENQKIGKKIDNDYVYNKEDFLDIYYVKMIDQFSNEFSSYFVKKYLSSDYAEYDAQRNVYITYGEKYLQEFNESIQNKSKGDIILYLNAEDDELISVEYNDEYSKKITLINTVIKEIPLYNCLLEFDIDEEVLTSDDLSELKELIDEKLSQKSTEKVLIK